MRTSWLRFVVAVRVAGAAAPDWLPASLRQLEPVALPGAWDALLAFFAPGGASERYRIALDPSARAAASAARAAAGEATPAFPPRRAQCVDGALRPGSWSSSGLAWDDRAAPWWNPEAFALTHGKWSTEARSRWGARTAAEARDADATVVMYQSRRNDRNALSWCRAKVAASSATWGRDGGASFWFTAASSRGGCCDGGQARDPGLLAHHFLGHVGEKRHGPWLFREARFADHLLRPTQYKAPATRDTAPKIRCFDERKDLLALFDADARKETLVMAAEGRAGGLEYDLRRALTDAWDPGGPLRAKRGVARAPPPLDPRVDVRFLMAKANYTESMRRAKYCVVTEGFSPWSPRLSEAVALGCVPCFLSPSLAPPYATVLDWSAFSVEIAEADVGRLPEVLAAYDWAYLHANLLRVRPLFAFCVDDGGEDGCGEGDLPGDGLPLVRGDEWECAMANKHACMCKKRVAGNWTYVGTTTGLKGNRPRLYHNR
ncbi:SET domain-containing protein [Aureococcus anophagefferens]|nr:SET domain-containing protein [Aureococcus anophagefferens]